ALARPVLRVLLGDDPRDAPEHLLRLLQRPPLFILLQVAPRQDDPRVLRQRRGRQVIGHLVGPGHCKQLRVRRTSLVAIHGLLGLERELWSENVQLKQKTTKSESAWTCRKIGVTAPPTLGSRLRAPNILW